MKPGRTRAWLLAGGIFVLGLCVGVGGTTLVGLRLVKRAVQAFPEGNGLADRAVARIGRDLQEGLDLNDEEAARVNAELARTADNLRSIRVEGGRRMRVELRETIARIAETLPPEKRAAFRARLLQRFERLGTAAPEVNP